MGEIRDSDMRYWQFLKSPCNAETPHRGPPGWWVDGVAVIELHHANIGGSGEPGNIPAIKRNTEPLENKPINVKYWQKLD